MTNLHINEIELEKLARASAGGSASEIIADNKHLQVCNVCRAKFEFFVKFYAAFHDESTIQHRRIDERIKHFAEKLTSSNIIYLKPFNAQPNLESIGVGKNSYVLAAQTVDEEVIRYKTAATFAAEDVHALVRINEDAENKLYNLFVLSENDDHRSHILIGIAEDDGEKFLIPTNRGGYAELPYSNRINWRNAALILMTPCEVIAFDDLDKNKSGEMIRGLYKFNFKIEEHQLTFNFLPDSTNLPHHLLLIYEDQNQICKQVEGTTITFTVSSDRKINEIKFFASDS